MGDMAVYTHTHTHAHTNTNTNTHIEGKNNSIASPFGTRLNMQLLQLVEVLSVLIYIMWPNQCDRGKGKKLIATNYPKQIMVNIYQHNTRCLLEIYRCSIRHDPIYWSRYPADHEYIQIAP